MKLTRTLKVVGLVIFGMLSGSVVMSRNVDGEEHQQEKNSPSSPQAPAQPPGPSKKSDLDSTVVYTARDSVIYNFDNRTMDLYGKAKVNYQNMIIQGPKISVDDKTSMVNANASTDSLGKPLELPVFTDRSGSFSAETMQYNFKTKKGRTSSVSSVVGEGLYTGEQVTRLSTGELYLKEGIYTTCNDPEPHYWFAGKNMKLIPKDKMVARPVVMYIHPEIFSHRLPIVPLLPLPFMSMSINRERASGFLLPKFARDSSRGFYLSDVGYFFAINDYMDLRLESDLAFNGSWRAAERFRYSKRYLYTGSVAAEYSRYQLNHPGDPEFDQFSNWNAKILHHQDFDPTTRLDLNLMYQGGRRNYDMNSINIESIINEQVTSNASFYKSFDEGERVLTGSYQRIKNLTTEDATQTLNVSLYQNKIYPFRPRKWSIDQSDWRSRLSVNPSASLTGQFSNVSAVETDNYAANASVEVGYQQDIAKGYKASVYQGLTLQQLYRTNDLDENRSGSMVQLPFKIQSTLFNYLYLNPSLTFSQYRVNSTISRMYDPLTASTLTRNIDEKTDYSTAVFTVDAQTRMYGILNTGFLENLIGLKAIRHTFIPTISYTANPDYTGTGYDNYATYQTPTGPVRYNRFESSLYSGVPTAQSTIGISLQNLFYGKFAKPADQVEADGVSMASKDKVVQLLSFTAATGYNTAADSLRLNPLTLSATSNALSPNLIMTAGAVYDFYSYDHVTGARINKLSTEDGGGLLRFMSGFFNMSLNIEGTLKKHQAAKDLEEGTGAAQPDKSTFGQALYRERFVKPDVGDISYVLPWKLRMSLYLNADRSNPLTPTTTALMNTYAMVSLSKVWQVGLNTGYDLMAHDFIFPAIQVFRDMHCWQMSAQWVPSGPYKSFYFQVGLKAPQLRDLRYKTSGSMK